MSSDEDTEAAATETADAQPTERVYAWQDELDEADRLDRRPLPTALMILLSSVVVCGIGLGAYVIGERANLHFPTTARPPSPAQRFVPPPQIGPFPVPSKLAPPPEVQTPPPEAQREAPPVAQPPPVQAAPPPAAKQFTNALNGDKVQTQGGNGLYPTQPASTINSEAQSMCQDLANGGAIQPYIDGTLAKSPSLAPWQAAQVVHQAIQAYCPQNDR